MSNSQEVVDDTLYTIEYYSGPRMLVHNWRAEAGEDIPKFKKGVATFAAQCVELTAKHAAFDASQLDPSGIVVQWISGQHTPEGEEPYGPWWMREIVSVYNEVGLKSLAIASGDPNASGEQPQSPPGCEFAMGIFTDMESARNWRAK
jgi:hypothetical protein